MKTLIDINGTLIPINNIEGFDIVASIDNEGDESTPIDTIKLSMTNGTIKHIKVADEGTAVSMKSRFYENHVTVLS